MTLDDYILSHIDPEPEYLHRLWRATHLHLNYPRMASGHLQGRLLHMLVHMIRPRSILEIGTYSGYSTLCMASALQPGALIHTIEINDEQEEFTRPWLENSPWAEHIRLYIGDALQLLTPSSPLLSQLISASAPASSLTAPASCLTAPISPPNGGDARRTEGVFSLVFIDADKRHYVDYYRAVLPLLSPGGFILADNTLWSGQVFDDQPHNGHNGKDAQTQGILAFNDLVASDSSVERVILPLRDGLTLIRKK